VLKAPQSPHVAVLTGIGRTILLADDRRPSHGQTILPSLVSHPWRRGALPAPSTRPAPLHTRCSSAAPGQRERLLQGSHRLLQSSSAGHHEGGSGQ
jgi:hypothetical protein